MTDLIDQLYSRFCQCPVISIDSRKISPGCLFFGLAGGHFDGSTFGAAAVESGAHVAVVRNGACVASPGVFFVDDPLAVLQGLAKHHRDQFDIPVIGITGSNGKTTTKELVNLVLSSEFPTGVTQGNFNNQIGVPLTLLSLKSSDRIAIVEMGANHKGEIESLCALAQPTHGIVTNIGKAHLEGFGGVEGVKLAKAELFDSLAKSGGVAFVNRDEQYLTELSMDVSNKVFYGFDETARFSLNAYTFSVQVMKSGYSVSFKDAENANWQVTTSLFGKFNLANVATAIAVGLYFKIPGQQICHAIARYIPDNNRSQRISVGSNAFILDAYNANPTSMSSAIKSFTSLAHPDKVMILGAMMELGEHALSEHMALARVASEFSDVTTILVGEQFESAARHFGFDWFPDVNALIDKFSRSRPENRLLLVKGSRSMQLERVLTAFQ